MCTPFIFMNMYSPRKAKSTWLPQRTAVPRAFLVSFGVDYPPVLPVVMILIVFA